MYYSMYMDLSKFSNSRNVFGERWVGRIINLISFYVHEFILEIKVFYSSCKKFSLR